jgi:hypothetical protein
MGIESVHTVRMLRYCETFSTLSALCSTFLLSDMLTM